ncbi:MAG: S-adenosylmethionine tRNA ribosyltransferase [Bacteroidetes bacterium RIFOXYA12_FULL_35_11]|nr:MAG: S-adenosylmethionine tRNA ribosyltransferase [Bacteroidetes bacterium GWF2_35_48]OFY82700.1 MAG: S-adenosylmethionine tRNA ribosyltransferase [Bacteroidetes bacterium RIFOXYA12_FULL_35_11]OFY93498.1 MAG: S-adenosylmethionine tRNA ribosyltransferase [Bacteroidetes bacterium RIFOXYB2_FULL_35_7]OFY95028.1 MAG: S-adenosylmethionine tRNA ribosyltransferase [Bacteroidetes bacterium RIFOXYC12_FULL_35_7]HBX51802.1 S-adenosylmethionine tRNA ribosyltransferase [Bacteroidales bacterium]
MIKVVENIRIEEYNYHLPDEAIAKYPLPDRDKSKLLIYKDNTISQDFFNNIKKYLPVKSTLFVNDSRVIQARIFFTKSTGAKIEVFCLEPLQPQDYYSCFSQTQSCVWKCIAGNLKKWKNEILTKKVVFKGKEITLTAEKTENSGTHISAHFRWNHNLTFSEILEIFGKTPLPPYLNREAEEKDKQTYQTVYSSRNGSVAAPTAGLHFSEKLISELNAHKINIETLTLHVGAGTFKPVKAACLKNHEMHTEFFSVNKKTIEKLASNNPYTIVGTTSLRTIESLYYIAQKIKKHDFKFHVSQWEPYSGQINCTSTEALNIILEYLDENNLNELSGSTQIMIAPGFQFQFAKTLITNFHQPQSTLLLLIAAFIGISWKEVYDYALLNNFRFLSYGDSMFLEKKPSKTSKN